VTHRKLALPLVAAAIIGLGACSSQNPGAPVANSSTGSDPTSGSSTSQTDPLASTDPCTLVTPSQVTGNDLEPPKPANAPGGRACRWTRPDDGATTDGYELQIVVYNTAGIDQLKTAGGTVTDTSVGKYHGKLFRDTPLDICAVSLATTDSSRIDIQANSNLGMDESCKLAQQLAPAVVANFPAGS
jgi:hypothetical protein